jgi:hypothetical protein
MPENALWTMKEVARLEGVNAVTISDLVRVLGIEPKPMTNGKAKGLDRSDRKQISAILHPKRVRAVAS